jgi:enoyl-[acyl-carrier protein] reductase I
MGFLANKKALIVGVASDRSIAYGIAEAMVREGAEIALTYQNEKLKERVENLGHALGASAILPCDVSSDTEIDQLFANLKRHWGALDIIIHSVAFAPKSALEGNYLDSVTRENFRVAQDVSAYSFAALAKGGRALMAGRPGALLTLSYLGAERAMPNYNVMGVAKASLEASVRYLATSLGPEGIRVNAVSAGPIRTLAASGIANFREMLSKGEQASPLRRNITIEEVGNAAAFLCSDLASGITGEIVYVDGGYNIVGLSMS